MINAIALFSCFMSRCNCAFPKLSCALIKLQLKPFKISLKITCTLSIWKADVIIFKSGFSKAETIGFIFSENDLIIYVESVSEIVKKKELRTTKAIEEFIRRDILERFPFYGIAIVTAMNIDKNTVSLSVSIRRDHFWHRIQTSRKITFWPLTP